MNDSDRRRVLSIWPTLTKAGFAGCRERHINPDAVDVRVEWGVAGTTPEKPWAVTAAKTKKRIAS